MYTQSTPDLLITELSDLLAGSDIPAFSAPAITNSELQGILESGSVPSGAFDLDLPVPTTAKPLTFSRPSTQPWDPRLVLDLALGIEALEDILPRYALTLEEYGALVDSPLFRRELALAERDLRENGLPFRAKARIQAEAYLEVLDELVYDASTPSTTRLEAIRSVVKWGNLEPKEEKEEGANAPAVNIQINF